MKHCKQQEYPRQCQCNALAEGTITHVLSAFLCLARSVWGLKDLWRAASLSPGGSVPRAPPSMAIGDSLGRYLVVTKSGSSLLLTSSGAGGEGGQVPAPRGAWLCSFETVIDPQGFWNQIHRDSHSNFTIYTCHPK